MTLRMLGAACFLVGLASSCASDDGVSSVEPREASVTEADPEALLVIGIGLPRDDDGLAELALAVSDPVDPAYGDHVSADEVGHRFGADDEVVDPILDVLADAGVDAWVDPSRALVVAPMTVEQASELFDTEFAVNATGTGTVLIEATRPPSVPAGLDEAQELIGFEEPILEPASASLLIVPSTGSTGTRAAPCDDASAVRAADLDDLFAAYGIDQLHARGLTGAGHTAAVITVSTYDPRALADYAACYGLSTDAPILHIVESGQPHPPTGEAAMDVELLATVAPDLERIDVFQTTAHGLAAPVLAIAAAMDPANTGGRPPDVLSASLGWCEQGIDDHVIDLLEHYLLVAAAVGTTVVSAAGNHGTAGCYPTSSSTAPHFPASSPWALAIGGTTLDFTPDGAVVETVWNDGSEWAGGGGYSDRYRRPSWQDSLVDLDARAYPDLALLADSATGYAVSYCPTVDECGWTALGGTSASTPVVAGALALVNQARAEMALDRLGLVAPRLYREAITGSSPVVARDVVTGDNRLFGRECCDAGPGLDQASGWGAPDFAALAALSE